MSTNYLYAELTGGTRLYLPEVPAAVAEAVQTLHATDSTVFGDPTAHVELPIGPDGGSLRLYAADLATVITAASVPF